MNASTVNPAHGQSQYQVRFDWGVEGALAIGDGADVIVAVDVLSVGLRPGTNSPDASVAAASQPGTNSPDASLLAALAEHPAEVVAASLRNRTAVAQWALERQGDKGDRFTIAVIACGEPRPDGSTRFAIEDLLGAGAVIDALADVGIDYCSPEAAAASAAFTGLRNATGHLIGASASGRELAEAGRRADIDLAIDLDASDTVPALRESGFHPSD